MREVKIQTNIADVFYIQYKKVYRSKTKYKCDVFVKLKHVLKTCPIKLNLGLGFRKKHMKRGFLEGLVLSTK